MLLHQQITVKRELINQIEQWHEHIADGLIENRDFQQWLRSADRHCMLEQYKQTNKQTEKLA